MRRIRVTHLIVQGLKSNDYATGQGLDLAPMTSFVGPNGSGKSAVLGAITYALRGHLPALKLGETAALVSGERLHVSLSALSVDAMPLRIEIGRGIVKGKAYARAFVQDAKTGKTREEDSKTGVDHLVTDLFGQHVDTYLSMGDPERSVLTMPSEKRLRWAFAAAAPRSGWDKDRVTKELGEAPEAAGKGYWQPHLSDDPVALVEGHLVKAEAVVRSAKAALKEQETALGALAQPISEPTLGELQSAAEVRKNALAAYSEARAASGRERDRAVKRGKILATLGDLDRAITRAEELSRSLPTREQDHRAALDEASAAQHEIADLDLELGRAAVAKTEAVAARAALEGKNQCPTCQSVLPRLVVDELRDALAKKATDLEQATDTLSQRRVSLLRKLDAADARVEAALGPLEEARAAAREAEAKRAQLAELEKLIGLDAPGGDPEALVKALADAEVSTKKALDEADAAHSSLHERQALARERARQKARLEASELAVASGKAWLSRLRDVRARMTADAATALDATLGPEEHALAPGVEEPRWKYFLDAEDGMNIGYLKHAMEQGGYVPYVALSASERVMAHAVLGASVPRLGHGEPWSVIFLDDVEVLEPAGRKKLFSYLYKLARAGDVSNVLVASSDERDVGVLAELAAQDPETVRVYSEFLQRR